MSRPRWQIKPKLHMLQHLWDDAVRYRMSPSSHWAFADEDFCGQMKRLIAACHPLTANYRCLDRYLLFIFSQYRDAI